LPEQPRKPVRATILAFSLATVFINPLKRLAAIFELERAVSAAMAWGLQRGWDYPLIQP